MPDQKLSREVLVDADGDLILAELVVLRPGEGLGLSQYGFQLEEYLASGSFGDCWRCKCAGKDWAVKILATPREWPEDFSAKESFKKELKVCTSPRFIDGPIGKSKTSAFVRLVAHGQLPSYVGKKEELQVAGILVYEYCDTGDLDTLLAVCLRLRVMIPEAVIWKWLIELIEACHLLTCTFIKNKVAIVGVLHDDIMPSNLFLGRADSNGQGWPSIRIGDYGLCKPAPPEGGVVRSTSGVSPYTHPNWPNKSPRTELWQLVHCMYLVASVSCPARPRNLPNANIGRDPYRNAEMYDDEMLKRRTGFSVVVHPLEKCYSDTLQRFFKWILEAKTPPTAYEVLQELRRVPRDMSSFGKVPEGLFLTYLEYTRLYESDHGR